MTALRDLGPPGPPAHLYVHVPFCRDRCTYCAFPTVPEDPDAHEALVAAILREAGVEASREAPWAPLDTVYLGGGTPGLLPPTLLERLLRGLESVSQVSGDAEVTLEVNPVNVTADALQAWSELGVTRLSVGVQTFQDGVLKSLARLHGGAEARRALELAGARWSGTWSADLLVGWVGQQDTDVAADLDSLIATNPPHISVYGLTVEPGTALERRRDKGHDVTVEASRAESLDDAWSGRLQAEGYERYEVSNFARPGHASRHNQAYWRNASYVGLGPGASSSVHPLRWVNERDLARYQGALEQGLSTRVSCERVEPEARLLESLAVGLRTREGCDLVELDRRFGPGWWPLFEAASAALLDAGQLHREAGRLRLAPEDLVRVDRWLAELAPRLSHKPDKGTL